MKVYTNKLIELLNKNKNTTDAQYMKKYMRNQFEFFGIKSTQRREILSAFLKENPPPQLEETIDVVNDLWNQSERECQYCAIEIMGKTHKNWSKEIIHTFENMLVNKSWWDSVDFINSELLSRYFKKYPEKIRPVTEGWMASNNIWLQRSCLIFQLNYKKQTDIGLLSEYILRLNGSNEFFLQKAIGWALRQYARTDAAWVKSFVEKTPLKPLSKREALKHIA